MLPWITTIVVVLFVTVTMASDECICDLDDASFEILKEEGTRLAKQMDAARHIYNAAASTRPTPLNPEDKLFTTDDAHLVNSNPMAQFPAPSPDDPSVIVTDRITPYSNYMPEVGNGHIATVINNEAIFMNGLYNGANITSHRARIPSTAAYVCYGFTPDYNVSYTLNFGKGYFMESHRGNHGVTVTLTTLVHRLYSRVIVNLLTMTREDPSKDVDVFVHLINGPPSEDIDFFKDDDGILLGRTRVAEYPELEPRTTFYMKTSASLEGRHIFSAGKTTGTIAAFTVIDVSRRKVLEEYNKAVEALHNNTLVPSHFKEWDKIWKNGRIDVEGNITLARINYAAMYYLFSSLPFNVDRQDWPFFGLSPGGLAHGDGDRDYMGHVFWDQDLWMSPGLSILHADVAKLLVKSRTRTLKAARLLAQKTGFQGVRYPWESAFTGLEVCPGSAYSELEIHVTGDVIIMLRNYWYLTKDKDMFLHGDAYEIVSGVAEFFASRVTYDSKNDSYRILGVMPPDEYNYPVDDSVYTNEIARCTLRFANELSRVFGKPENVTWRKIADKMMIPYDRRLDYNPEFDGYQIGQPTKQADVILLSYPLMVPLKDSTRINNLNTYEKSTPIGPAPAMTWSIFLIDWLDLGNEAKAAELFNRSILNAQKPFFIWTENSDGKGATNFLTGMGGHLQSLIFGYGGCRIHQDHMFFNPKMIPSTKSATFTGIDYMGCSFDLHYTDHRILLTLTSINEGAKGLEIQILSERSKPWKSLSLNTPVKARRGSFKIRPINA